MKKYKKQEEILSKITKDPKNYIGLITCAHNLFMAQTQSMEATLEFGRHGAKDTIKFKGRIVPKSVMIPDEYRKYSRKCLQP